MKNKKTNMRLALGLAVLFLIAVGIKPLMKAFNGMKDVADIDEIEAEKLNPVGPAFNADSAYMFIEAQCNFGPRAMNTEGHEKCLQWIIDTFKELGCKVRTQKADLQGYDGTILKSTNVMAQYQPEKTTRVMLCAHWDSRPWADNDPDSTNWHKPILAANDAASGVGVMMEIARLLQQEKDFPIGVDFVCFDAEDWGAPQWYDGDVEGNTWALGSAYFAENLPEGYEARYGILLDMVGGQGAKFYRERFSKQYASAIVKKVWKAARQAGYGSFFPKGDGGYVTDDHVPMNQKTNIPTIDIISYYPDCAQSSFGPTWHTISDDVEHIDKNTLKAVGQTLIQVLFTEIDS